MQDTIFNTGTTAGPINGLSKNEQRLQSLLEILEFRTNDMQKLLELTLEKAIALTESQIGYIYFYDEKKRLFTLNNWSKGVMKECTVTDPQSRYELDKTGAWGEVVRQRKVIMINDFNVPNPILKGYPEGHAPLHKFLAIPIFQDDEIVATVGVANKLNDYNDEDVQQLQLMMSAVWKRIREDNVSHLLNESEEKSKLYLQIIPAMVLALDYNGIVTMINDEGCHLLGGTYEEIIGKNWVQTFVPKSQQQSLYTLLENMRNGTQVDSSETNEKDNEIIDLKGGHHRVFWKSKVLKDERGNLKEVISAGQDMTEILHLKESLLNSEAKFRSYFDHSPQGIFVTDLLGNYKTVNPKGCEQFGYSLDELIGKNIMELVIPDGIEKAKRDFSSLYETGFVLGKYKLRRKDGVTITLRVNAVKLPSDESIAFCDDITEDEAITEQLRAQNEQLTRMNELMIERELKMVELKEKLKEPEAVPQQS